MKIGKSFAIALASACVASIVSQASAQTPAYGYTFFDQAYAGTDNPNNDLLNVQGLSYRNSISTSGPTGTAAFSGKISNAILKLSSSTTNPDYGESFSNGDMYSFDTFTINGPASQTGLFTFKLRVNGSVQVAGGGQADLICTYTLFMNGTIIPAMEYEGAVPGSEISVSPTSPPSQFVSVQLPLTSGEVVVFGELLQVRNVEIGGNGSLDGGSTSIAVKKASVTVTPPKGFSFTTASGLTYH
jgi:hypothetical protein